MTGPDENAPQDEVSIEDALPVDDVSDDVELNTPVEENVEDVEDEPEDNETSSE